MVDDRLVAARDRGPSDDLGMGGADLTRFQRLASVVQPGQPLTGRTTRDASAWSRRVRLVEQLQVGLHEQMDGVAERGRRLASIHQI